MAKRGQTRNRCFFHGGDFFFACEDFGGGGGRFDKSVHACTLFSVCLFFKVEISSRTPVPHYRLGSIQWLSELRRLWSSFSLSDGFPPCLYSLVSPPRLRWGQRSVCMVGRNLPPDFQSKRLGTFTCHCSNARVQWTPNKSQHRNLENKILPLSLPEIEPGTFLSRVRRSTNGAGRKTLCGV